MSLQFLLNSQRDIVKLNYEEIFFLFILQFLNAEFLSIPTRDSKRLEKEKAKLVSEIKQINSLLFSNNSIKKSAIDEIKDLDVKIKVRNKLIRFTNQEINLISKQININQRDLETLRLEVAKLK